VARADSEKDSITPTECLIIKPVGEHGRTPVHIDEIELQVVARTWKRPKAGDDISFVDGSKRKWEALQRGKVGAFEHASLRGGYAYFTVHCDQARIMLLEASGHSMVYVNDEPRTGDPYSTGYVRLPVALREGDNDLLFFVGSGSLKVRLVPPRAPVMLDGSDVTAPDLLIGGPGSYWASVVVINATEKDRGDLYIHAVVEPASAGGKWGRAQLPPIPRLSVRKVLFDIAAVWTGGETAKCTVSLARSWDRSDREEVDKINLDVRARRPEQTHKRTFLSAIDDSVQYYAVNPAHPSSYAGDADKRLALFLTLHGAGVEALGQVEAYSRKSWGHLVAPTNRRPFGFDWEDWGRLDAIEVLDRAQRELNTDPSRTYLTGHSMGGHGTWHIGGNYPDRFAAIGPSAGWVAMWTYAGAQRPDVPTRMVEMLQRATNAGDPITLIRNYLHHAVYVLHGADDDNVPVDQARLMQRELTGLHKEFYYHEQPKAGHWWDASDEPGTDCVDWAPMFDMFAHHVIPGVDMVREVDFTTASPGVSARSHWLTIEDQIHPGRFSSARIRLDPGLRRFSGKTRNVTRLSFDLHVLQPGSPIRVELDDVKLPEIPWPEKQQRVWLVRTKDGWRLGSSAPLAQKGPHRYGPFKDAFRNHVAFVYGTKGSGEENAWAYAKARFDAETFWYRGNGSIDVFPDTQEVAQDRNVILYGNAETNGAWKALLADSPIQVDRTGVRFGVMEKRGDDLACLFVRPRPGSDRALVGVVSGTGIAGMRLTDRLPYFMSGVGYPDLTIMGSDVLKRGVMGIRWAGYFGSDWSMKEGEFVGNQ
jgi:dienelactone hydrolase